MNTRDFIAACNDQLDTIRFAVASARQANLHGNAMSQFIGSGYHNSLQQDLENVSIAVESLYEVFYSNYRKFSAEGSETECRKAFGDMTELLKRYKTC